MLSSTLHQRTYLFNEKTMVGTSLPEKIEKKRQEDLRV